MLDPNTAVLLSQLGIDPHTAEAVLEAAFALTVLTIAAAIPTVWLARRRGRSVAGWLLFALCLPLLPLLLLWWLPPVGKASDRPDPPAK